MSQFPPTWYCTGYGLRPVMLTSMPMKVVQLAIVPRFWIRMCKQTHVVGVLHPPFHANFFAISMVFPQILAYFQSISNNFLSFSISFCQLHSVLINFNDLQSIWLGQNAGIIDNREVGKTTRKTFVVFTCMQASQCPSTQNSNDSTLLSFYCAILMQCCALRILGKEGLSQETTHEIPVIKKCLI